MTRLPFLLVLTLLLLFVAQFIPAAETDDPVLARHQAYANAHNAWAHYIGNLSPDSPDYRERVAQEWERREVSKKFRRLEEAAKP